MPVSCLARIKQRDSVVRGWAYRDNTAAAGTGPLAGLVVGVKDVIDVAGMPTTHGSPIFSGSIAPRDAEAVARLRQAGAVILGKTVTAEFATYHPGPTENPRKAGHTPGGSSSGSAAVVADGQADLALGTQTAGSMIRPASFCGVLGFKPSFGRYPLDGVLQTAPNLDTLGMFARTLEIMRATDAVIARDESQPSPREKLTVGLCRSPAWAEADTDMQTCFNDFGRKLIDAGHIVETCELPPEFAHLANAQKLLHDHETWKCLDWIRKDHDSQVSDSFRAMMARGASISEAEYAAALALQRSCKLLLAEVFKGRDVLLSPGAPGAAPAGLQATGNPAFQRLWTALGVPCLGFPAAWRDDGLPLGLQIIGAPGSDRMLLANAEKIMTHAALREIE